MGTVIRSQILHPDHVMPQLANIEDALGDWTHFSKHNPLALAPDVLTYDGLGLEHLQALLIRLLASDHPGRCEFAALSNVDLSVLFDGVLTAERICIYR